MSRLRRAVSLGTLGQTCLLACICLLAPGAAPALGASPEPSRSVATTATTEPDGAPSSRPGPSPSASPSASPDPGSVTPDLLESVDTRSEGAGPGLVGSPLTILLGVMALGILSALVTAAWVRLTRQG